MRKKVFYISKKQANVLAARKLLKNNFQVIGFTNTKSCLDFMNSEKGRKELPNLIIADHTIPSSFELDQLRKSKHQFPSVNLIMLSEITPQNILFEIQGQSTWNYIINKSNYMHSLSAVVENKLGRVAF